MASGLIFDPIQLLRVAPLASSTGSLVFATSELIFNSAFLQPSIREKSDKVLPKWYSHAFNRAVVVVLVLNVTSISTAVANIFLDRRHAASSVTSPASLLSRTTFYWAGLAGAIGHLLFVPAVATPIQRMVEDEKGEIATDEMEKWLGFHRVRMLLADLPAWLSFVGAAMLA